MLISLRLSRAHRVGLIAALLAIATQPALAAGACTDVLRLDESDGDSIESCISAVLRDAAQAGYNAAASDEAVGAARFQIGTGVVITRCIEGGSVAFSAFHVDQPRACELIERIRDAITGD